MVFEGPTNELSPVPVNTEIVSWYQGEDKWASLTTCQRFDDQTIKKCKQDIKKTHTMCLAKIKSKLTPGASNGEVLLLHGGQDRGSRLQQCLERSLGDLFRPRLPRRWKLILIFLVENIQDFETFPEILNFSPRRWRLDVGSRCRPRQHPRLQCSSHRDDQGQEDNASPRLGCQHLWHCRRHSSVRCWIFSPAMVGVSRA